MYLVDKSSNGKLWAATTGPNHRCGPIPSCRHPWPKSSFNSWNVCNSHCSRNRQWRIVRVYFCLTRTRGCMWCGWPERPYSDWVGIHCVIHHTLITLWQQIFISSIPRTSHLRWKFFANEVDSRQALMFFACKKFYNQDIAQLQKLWQKELVAGGDYLGTNRK